MTTPEPSRVEHGREALAEFADPLGFDLKSAVPARREDRLSFGKVGTPNQGFYPSRSLDICQAKTGPGSFDGCLLSGKITKESYVAKCSF
jgi:hypothetical protein